MTEEKAGIQAATARDKRPWVRRAMLALAALAASSMAAPAAAQSTSTFTNSTPGVVNETAATCAAPLTRNFVVGPNFSLSKVTIGVRLDHTWRGDLRLFLVSPTGTSVTLQQNIGDGRDNLSVLFDDAAPASITTHTAVNDNATIGPPYQRTFSPQTPLSAFNGQSSAGTWQLRICDALNGDSGNFQRADLFLTSTPSSFADLSLAKVVSTASPTAGAAISYTLTVTSAGASNLTANGVTVTDNLPASFTYTSHSAGGGSSFTPGTGLWSVGSLTPGQSRTLTINGIVNASAGASVTNVAEISASSVPDSDSTPGNGVGSEDDAAAATFSVAGTRVAGVPPTLICPAGTTSWVWTAGSWPGGSLNNSYAVTNLGTINLNMAISGGVFLDNAGLGGQSPTSQNIVTGGFAGPPYSVIQLTNFTSQAGNVMTSITLPTAVAGVQFRLFDVDFGANQFADRVIVTGSFSGAPVSPVLTNGVANFVAGNTAIGDAASDNTSGNGNLTVTFTGPVDTIVFEYGNHTTAPVDPGQQAIALHQIDFCRPSSTLTAIKSSTLLSDPVNGATDPKAVPGATLRYCVTVSNAGPSVATGVVITDTLPANITFVPGTIRSGTSCAGAATAVPDSAFASGTITRTVGNLDADASAAVTFEATVN